MTMSVEMSQEMNPQPPLRMTAELKDLAAIRCFVQETATALKADPDVISDVILAANEAVTNVIIHGYQGQPGPVEVEVERDGASLVVRVRDQAPPFDPNDVPAPDLTLPLERRACGGMGVYMIKRLVDQVIHLVTPQGGNELTLIKKQSILKEETNEHSD